MGDQLITAMVTILTAIVGVAFLSVLVSKNSNTSGVISAGGSAFAQDLATAVSPVSGGSLVSGLNFTGNSINTSL